MSLQEQYLQDLDSCLNQQQEMFKCPLCNKDFLGNVDLQAHMVVHMSRPSQKSSIDKPYACAYCPHRASRKDYLVLHQRIHTGEKPYKCEQCDYRAAQRTSLKYHILRHHKQDN